MQIGRLGAATAPVRPTATGPVARTAPAQDNRQGAADDQSRLIALLVALDGAHSALQRSGAPSEFQGIIAAVQALRARVAAALQDMNLQAARSAPAPAPVPAPNPPGAATGGYTEAGQAATPTPPAGMVMNTAI